MITDLGVALDPIKVSTNAPQDKKGVKRCFPTKGQAGEISIPDNLKGAYFRSSSSSRD